MKAFNYIAVIIFVGAAGFITYNLVKDSNNKYYTTTKAEVSTIESKLLLSGFVYPSKEIDVKPQISGVVDAIYVKAGDVVREGDPIASVSLVPNSSEVEQLRNAVSIAKINLSTATAVFERQKQLFENKSISKADFEVAEKELLISQENYSTAMKQFTLRQKGKHSSNNVILSSTSGVIIDVPVKIGSSVMERSNYNVGSTIAIIAGADHYIFKADVPEKYVVNITIGMPVKLSFIVYDDKEVDATITNVSAKGEFKGGAVKFSVEADFTLADDSLELRSGYSATGEIVLNSAYGVLTLPEKCINFRGDTTFVYVKDSIKNQPKEVIVSLGISDGERVQILGGISSEDYIITNYHD